MKKLLSILGAVGLTATGASFAVSCSGDASQSKNIKIIDVQKAVGEIKNKSSLIEVQSALDAKLKETKNNTLKLIKSLKAEVKVGSQTDVIVKVVAKENYKLDYATFEIAGAIANENSSKDLTVDLNNTNLGKLNDNQEKTIMDQIKTLNPNVVTTEITISNITATEANINVISNSNVYNALQTPIKVTFTIAKSTKDLTVDLNNTNLGKLNDNQEKTIMDQIKTLNPNVVTTEITISNITATEANINVISNSNVYNALQTPIKVTFTIAKSTKDLTVDLNNILLGKLSDNQEKTIMDEIITLNPNVVTTEITISNITENEADINVINNSSVYNALQTPMQVNFTIGKNLSVDLNNTDLGKLNDNQEKTIMDEIITLNPNVVTTEITISNITATDADINVINNSSFYNDLQTPIKVTFTIAKSTKDLTVDLKNTDLGKLSDNQEKTIMDQIKTLNPNVVTTEITISNITATDADINVISNSSVYNALQTPIKVTFTI